MKKILSIFIMLSISFFTIWWVWAACEFNENSEIKGALNGCISTTTVVHTWWDVDVASDWFKSIINNWTKQIVLILGVLAVGSIVYWALLMTVSAGEDEKIKKAKDIVKWGCIWFVWMITASGIITLVVQIMYSL